MKTCATPTPKPCSTAGEPGLRRYRIPGFVALARTIRERRHGILAAVRLGLSNGRVEGLNNRVRLITRRGFGFRSAGAAAALVMLSRGPINLTLPHEK